jgi:uncharacterized repeat protein (TIGR04138 family)
MSLRSDLAAVAARDARYAVEAYLFVLEALEHTKQTQEGDSSRDRRLPKGTNPHHVTGQELCQGARDLALACYGLLAREVLHQWGIHSTSDLGEIVYNMIAGGVLEKTPEDDRSHFDGVFDLERSLRESYEIPLDSAS